MKVALCSPHFLGSSPLTQTRPRTRLIVSLSLVLLFCIVTSQAQTSTQVGGLIWITDTPSNQVLTVDSGTNQLFGSPIPVGASPTLLAASPDQSRIYVGNFDDGTISVIDAASRTVIRTITASPNIYWLVVSPDGNVIYYTDRDTTSTAGHVHAITADFGTQLRDPVITNIPLGIAISVDGSLLYVSVPATGAVQIVDAATFAIVGSISTPNGSFGVTINTTGTRLYIANPGTPPANGSVTIVDLTNNNAILATVPTQLQTLDATLTPDGTAAWAFNQGSNSITVFDTSAPFGVITTITNVPSPGAIAISPDGAFAYSLDLNAIDIFKTTDFTKVVSIPGFPNIFLGFAIPTSAPPTSVTITRPIVANQRSDFNFGPHTFSVGPFPADVTVGAAAFMSVTATTTSQAAFQILLNGGSTGGGEESFAARPVTSTQTTTTTTNPFAGETCIVYTGEGGNCILYDATCTDAAHNPTPCPFSATFDIPIKTTYDTTQQIIGPDFLHQIPGTNNFESIFDFFSLQKVDPTTGGKGKNFSPFVATQRGLATNVSLGTFSGFLPPLGPKNEKEFRSNSTIPVKFRLKDSKGKKITNATARIAVARGTTPITPVSTNGTGVTFVYDPVQDVYQYNLSTKKYKAGIHTITVTGNDFPAQQVSFRIDN